MEKDQTTTKEAGDFTPKEGLEAWIATLPCCCAMAAGQAACAKHPDRATR